MDKKELQEIANSVFERYPRADKVFITTAGQAFFDEVHAKNHATPRDLDIETFRRDGEADDELGGYDLDEMSRAELEAFVKDNTPKVKFDEKTADDVLRTLIVAAIEMPAQMSKKTTKKAKK